MKRFHWFAYHAPRSESKAARRKAAFDASGMIHQMRDAAAFVEISHALASLGLSYQGPLLNIPEDAYKESQHGDWVAPEDFRAPVAGDLLVQCTRPPLNDERMLQSLKEVDRVTSKPKVRMRGQVVGRSLTKLENAVTAGLQNDVLGWCSRGRVRLSPTLCQALQINPRLGKYADIGFRTEVNARFVSWASNRERLNDSDAERTAGYLVFLPRLAQPYTQVAALFAWGQSGADTLFWNWTLHHTGNIPLRLILTEPHQIHVMMADWRTPNLHRRPTSLQAFESITVRWLFHATRALTPDAAWQLHSIGAAGRPRKCKRRSYSQEQGSPRASSVLNLPSP